MAAQISRRNVSNCSGANSAWFVCQSLVHMISLHENAEFKQLQRSPHKQEYRYINYFTVLLFYIYSPSVSTFSADKSATQCT